MPNIPLQYQSSQADCAPNSILNALKFLFDQEEIPALVIAKIFSYSFDCDFHGNLADGGTSSHLIQVLCDWLTNYTEISSNINNKYRHALFNVDCKILNGEEVTIEVIDDILKKKGVAVVTVAYEGRAGEHVVLITGKRSKLKYLIFDPYYQSNEIHRNLPDLLWIDEKNYKELKIPVDHLIFRYNRIVSRDRLDSETDGYFSLGPKKNRFCIKIFRIMEEPSK